MGPWKDITALTVHPLDLAFRALIVYLAVLLLLRLAGKRQLGQASPTEFVAILLIANAVQNAMNAGDNSLTGGLILATVLIFLSWLISLLTYRSKIFSTIFEGTPRLLVHKGEPLARALARERITSTELRAMLRKQGVEHVTEVHTAILEADGSLSITRQSEARK